MRRPGRLAILMLAAAGLAAAAPARGQGSVQVNLSTTAVAFTTPGIADFDTGWIDHGGVTVSVSSKPTNRPWELQLRATTGTLGQGKPIGELQWRRAGSSVWTPVTETTMSVIQGVGDQDITIYFRMLLSWAADAPGSYSAGLEFIALRI